MSAAEMRLVVAERVESGPIVRLWLAHPAGGPLPGWEPGAHIALVLGDQMRYYSLAGDPRQRDRYQIAVRLDPDSTGGSRWVHEHLTVGVGVGVRLPRNDFPFQPASRYIFVAGGVGVTPLSAMAIVASRLGSPWELLYGAHTRSAMVFLDDLRELAESSGLGVVRALPQDEFGLLPVAELAEPRPDTAIYCCGPEPLLDAVEDATEAWPAGSVHIERYAPRRSPRRR